MVLIDHYITLNFVCVPEEKVQLSPAGLWHEESIITQFSFSFWSNYLFNAIVSLIVSGYYPINSKFNSYWFIRFSIFNPSLPYLWQITYGVRSASVQANVMLYWFLRSALSRGRLSEIGWAVRTLIEVLFFIIGSTPSPPPNPYELFKIC